MIRLTINAQLSTHNVDGEGGDDIYNINNKVANLFSDIGGNNIYNINTNGASIFPAVPAPIHSI